MVIEKYIIANKQGEYFSIDQNSGGYPYFSASLYQAEKFDSIERIKSFLEDDDYARRMFKSSFENVKIKRLTITVEDVKYE